jgi:energy-coupling factor transporter ATP-binding protein EcfA2
VSRLRSLLGDRVDAGSLAGRFHALHRFLSTVQGRIPAERLAAAQALSDRAGRRLSLSREHTVVALAGATGSGKSSIFNAMARLQLSRVGVRRPTTGVAHACVWGTSGAAPLLDWLGVPPASRFNRESPLDAEDESRLRGLVLLDLPDFDSVEAAHRVEVDRLLELVDLVVWVLDPQKYADSVVHQQYLSRFAHHREITVVLLNQADLLGPADAQRCIADLDRLLAADGLPGVPVLPTSTTVPGGLAELRDLLERTVAARQAALRRLAGDLDATVADLSDLVGPALGDPVHKADERALADALALAAGVPAVVAATGRAYTHRARAAIGWPVARWLRKLRRDPLHRLRLDTRPVDGDAPVPASSLAPAAASERATVALAVRGLGDRASGALPEPWPAAVRDAARSRLDDVPDALDLAVASTDLGVSRTPLWWRLVGGLQWLVTLAALVGLVWLGVRYALFALGLPALPDQDVGRVPLPTVLLGGGLLAGLLLGALARPLVRIGARRARSRADGRLRARIAEVAREMVVTPVRLALAAYTEGRAALQQAGARR